MANESWKSLGIKDRMAIVTAVLAFIIGWALVVAGFVSDPIGEVADSVLWILGQALIYTGSVFGISAYFNSETTKLKRDIRGYVQRSIKGEEIIEKNDE